MNQLPQMPMGGMAGGPVGGQQMNAGTPSSGSVGGADPSYNLKRLNTAIYDHLLRHALYDIARQFYKAVEIETDLKKSPNQRGGHSGQQPNGIDENGIDIECKEIRDRPDDLPAPIQLGEGPFLQDWWCQFWEINTSHRSGKGRPATLNYIGAQRQAQKARTNTIANMDPASMQNMRGYNGMMQGMGNGMGMPNDLKRAAMQNTRNMNPQQMAQQMQNLQAIQKNAQAMQGQQMERQGSQMDMSGPRSSSPASGDAPSPKRQRLEANMQQMNQGRPMPPGQLQNNPVGPPNSLPITAPAPQTPSQQRDPALAPQALEVLRQNGIELSQAQLLNLSMQPTNHQVKAVETYSQSIQQHMKAAMNSNLNKGMPPNAAAVAAAAAAVGMGGPQGQQGSPMNQAGIDSATSEFYAMTNGRSMMPNNAAAVAAGQAGNNGNHALQDYQMQLMLLEQQNKKRLLMARQEQDSMAHPSGMPGANGQFAPGMSPQGSRGADPSPNPNDIQRGTPKIGKAGMSPNGDMAGRGSPGPGMMDPSMMQAQLRQGMMGPNGQMMRPPSSHPMGVPMTAQQMEMMRQQQQAGQAMQMPNGVWQPGQQPPQMMPGQQPGPLGQAPPNMTPRQSNQPMAPPPVPAGGAQQGGTQPSSPAQPPAPPTPSQASKPKPGSKAEKKKNAAANKKGANTTNQAPASEAEAPPTPTPAAPTTPMQPMSMSGPTPANKNMPNGQPAGPNQTQQNPNQPPGQQGTQPQQPPQPQPSAVQPPAPDMGGAPFGSLDGTDQFGSINMDFANLDGGDVLDNFDFDSFLNNTGDGDGGLAFDANFAFGDAGLEAGADLGGN